MTIFSSKKLTIHVLLIICVLLTIFPFIWMVITSLKTYPESILVPPTLFPKKFMWSNFVELFHILPFTTFYINSVINTVVTVVGQVGFASMAAYAFARLEFPFKRILFITLLSIMMVPGQIYMIPQYHIIQYLGLLNSIPALFLPALFSAYGTFLLRQFFMSLPKEIEEAAYMDGCNTFQVFYKVMVPLAKPGILAFGIIVMLWSWNGLMWPMIVNTSPDKTTVTAGLQLLSSRSMINYPLMMVGAMLGSLPMFIIFVIFQRQLISGITIGAVKG